MNLQWPPVLAQSLAVAAGGALGAVLRWWTGQGAARAFGRGLPCDLGRFVVDAHESGDAPSSSTGRAALAAYIVVARALRIEVEERVRHGGRAYM